MDERRCETRSRRLKSGTIIFNNKQSVLDCRLQDVSTHGARLVLVNSLNVPDEFQVTIPGVADRRWARRAWMKYSDVGIQFL